MSETFSILSLKEMKLQAGSSAAAAAGEDEDEDGSTATLTKKVLQAAQKKLVQQVSGGGRGLSVDRWRSLQLTSPSAGGPQVHKKVFIEHTVPLIISLKNLLEQKRSPVQRELMTYLQVGRSVATVRTHICQVSAHLKTPLSLPATRW